MCRDAKRKERSKNRFDVHFVVAEKWKGQDALATFLTDSHGRPAPGWWVRPNTEWFETSIVGNMPSCHVKSQRNESC
jgi:hypothetical protein